MPKTTKLESQIYTHALKAKDQTFSNDELSDNLFTDKDVQEKLEAINRLLKKNLLQLVTLSTGGSGYKAVSKESAKKYKEMDNDEQLAYQYIDASGNEGIWTKTLKMKTNLHQTVVNRVLKSLEGRGSIKSVKSVKHPTRKIYMISSLNPSVELTGGPWYTDNELDTEFVNQLKGAVLSYIRERSYPKIRANNKPIYSTSKSHYPSVAKVHKWVLGAGVTPIELDYGHIQSLLDVLMFDGEVERLPALSAAMSSSEDEDYSESEASDSSDSDSKSRKKRRKHKKSKSRSKKKSRRHDTSDEESESESEDDRRRKKNSRSRSRSRSKSKKRDESDKSDVSDKSDGDDDEKPRKKHKKSIKALKSSSEEESIESESESESEEDIKRKKKSSKSKKHKKSKKSKKKYDSDDEDLVSVEDSEDEQKLEMKQADPYSNSVYRAIKNTDSDDVGPVVGWTEAPCGRCPVFEFCSQDGPVNASKCQYFDLWLQGEADEEMEE